MDPTEEIFLAAQAGGHTSVVALQKLAVRHATEYHRTHSPDAAFLVGRIYYELPIEFPRRSRRVREWLERSIVGRPQDVMAYYLLGCIAFDEKHYLYSMAEFEKIPPGAFAELSPHWRWRDIKVLELLCAGAIRINDPDRLRSVALRYIAAIQNTPEDEIPAPHELVAAVSAAGECAEAVSALSAAMDRHVEIAWGDPLGSEVAWLAKLAHRHSP